MNIKKLEDSVVHVFIIATAALFMLDFNNFFGIDLNDTSIITHQLFLILFR